jgi:hypothetical protein
MRRHTTMGLSAVAAVLAFSGMAAAQQAQRPAAAEPAIEPEALAALTRMGGFLRTQRSLEVKADTTTDEVLASGQKIQLDASVDLRVRRPDRLRADVRSDRKSRRLYYDGKTFTVFGARAGYYATVAAPPTIQQLLDVVAQRYGLEFPLADLFYWGTPKSGVGDIRAATSLGRSSVAGVACDHYAFRQADVDWQIWIEQGTSPLPRKLLITSIKEPGQPQYTAVMNWTLSPLLENELFAFVPPKDAQRIPLAPLEGTGVGPTRQGRPTATTNRPGRTP